MEGERAARAMRTALADRLRHVREAKDAIIAVGVGVLDRDLAPILGGGGDLDLAPEIIGIRNDQRALLAIKFYGRVPVPGNIEAHGHRASGAAREQERARHVSRDLD